MSEESRVLNLPGFEGMMNKLADALAEEILVNAAMAGALPIQNEAKRLAPKRTRNLSRSIHTEVKERARHRVRVTVGTDVEYAAIHEFGGTINHPGGTPYIVTKGGARWLRKDGNYPANVKFTQPHKITIPARPYMRPAADKKTEAALSAVKRAIVAQLQKVAEGQ